MNDLLPFYELPEKTLRLATDQAFQARTPWLQDSGQPGYILAALVELLGAKDVIDLDNYRFKAELKRDLVDLVYFSKSSAEICLFSAERIVRPGGLIVFFGNAREDEGHKVASNWILVRGCPNCHIMLPDCHVWIIGVTSCVR